MAADWDSDSEISEHLEGRSFLSANLDMESCRREISRKLEAALAGCQPLAGQPHQQCVLRICDRLETGEPRPKKLKPEEKGATLYVLRELLVFWSPVMRACLEFSTETDSSNSAECPVIDVEEFSFEVVTLFVNFLYRGEVDCDGMSIRLELARMGRYYAVSLLQKLMFLEMEIEWARERETPPSVDDFHKAGFDLDAILQDFDFSSGHLDYLKVVGFSAQDFLVCSDSLPVSKRFPLLFAVDRVFDNNPNYTFAMLKNATQRTQEIVYVLRQVPWDQIRLIDDAALAQSVGPDDLWQIGFSFRRDNGTSIGCRLLESEIVSRIIACKYTVQSLLDAGWNSSRFQRHAESTHLALARAGYDYGDLRELGFTVRLLERCGVRQT